MTTTTNVYKDVEMNSHPHKYPEYNTEFKYHPFENKQIRNGFVRKVYGLLSVQLFTTFAFGIMFMCYKPAAEFTHTDVGNALVWASMMGTFGTIFGLACWENIARRFPYNYIILCVFTLCNSYMVGFITCQYNTRIVAIAAGSTMFITTSLTAFACQTRYDFTAMGAAFLSLLVVLLFIGSMSMFFDVLTSIYAGMSAFVFSLYIIYDTQLIVGGKHQKYQYGVDDYVFATLSIYLDIINVFLAFLQLFNNTNT